MVLPEERLIEKLRRIEALHAGAKTPGERRAAACARDRIVNRLRLRAETDPPVEYRFSIDNAWSRRVFIALLRRYDLEPYRYPRQRRTTIMVRVPASFVEETLWPEFEEIEETLRAHLDEITNRVIGESLSSDLGEARVRSS